jgi:phage terminase small subunit
MRSLKNAKHERFAQELAKGKTADEAYRLAGFKANRGNAATLKAKQSISDRVRELQERVVERVE